MFVFQILLNSLVTSTQVLLLAAGLYLVYAVARFQHIALGAIATASAYAFLSAQSLTGAPWLSFIIGMAVSGLLSYLSFFVLRKYIDHSQDLLALLVSLTLGVCLESIIGIAYGPEGRFLVPEVLPVYQLAGLHLTQVGLWTIAIGLFVALLTYIALHLLPLGRLVRAISQHRECATIMGINTQHIRRLVFVVAGILVGIVGMLSGLNNAVTPTSGLLPIITAFIALMVGGVTDFRGTAVATFILVLLPELIVSLQIGGLTISVSWKMVIVFLLALCLLMIRPRGLFHSLNRNN